MESERFKKAIALFDHYNANDPNKVVAKGTSTTKELLYAQRMSEQLLKFKPTASEALHLAARCQHVGRWEIARTSYPITRKGYLQWRSALKMYHAEIAEKTLADCGYDAETIQKVKDLVLKKSLQTNTESQTLEDVVCLVFIEHYLEEFAVQHEEEKVVDIIRKTLKKMSKESIQAAAHLPISDKMGELIQRATKGPGLFKFEEEFMEGTVRCIPMVVRFKLDACGIKLKLEEWNKFQLEERNELTQSAEDSFNFKKRIESLIASRTGNEPTPMAIDKNPAWAIQDSVDNTVMEQAKKSGWTVPIEIWRDLTDLQRFALLKLSRPSHENKNFSKAMREFGLID